MAALVLIADADPFNLRFLSELCGNLGYEVVTAAEGEAVLTILARTRPGVLLLDVALPGIDGLQLLQIIKSDSGLGDLPVLLVTAETDEGARREGLRLGAHDYVAKPYKSFEVQQRVRNALRLRAIADAATEVTERIERLHTVDPMTGAGTRSQLHIGLDYEFTRAARYHHPLGCLYVRCVNFGPIASLIGGVASERVLVPLSKLLGGCIRGVDHLFRAGPDSFAILLPETGPDGCNAVRDRVHARLAEHGVFESSVLPRPRVTVGTATYPSPHIQDGESLLKLASQREA
jgi:two-component system, cell cycle response regulator